MSQENNHLTDCRFLPQIFTPEECQYIVNMDGVIQEASVMLSHSRSIQDPQTRKTTIKFVNSRPDTQWLFERVGKRIDEINRLFYRFEIERLTSIQIMTYRDRGFYTWHVDLGSGAASTRKLSIVIPLSRPEDYDGGKFETLPFIKNIPQEQGTMLVFPPYLTHRVTPVTRGVRHSLVTWAHGPCFR